MTIDLPALDQYDDPYPIRDLDDWFRQPEVPWLIEDIIPSQGTGFIYGPTGQYKSFVAIAIAGLVNTKQPLVEKAVTSQGRSLFCLMEGYQAFGYRVLGWQQYYDDTPLLAKFWDYPVDLSNDSKVDDLIERVQDAHIPDLRLIFIDTWIKSIGVTQTNSDIETIQCIRNMERISKALSCFVFAIDHPGKDVDRGLRGSSAKEQAVDLIIQVKALTDDVSLSATKVKDGDISVLNHTFPVRKVLLKPLDNADDLGKNRKLLGNNTQTLLVDFMETKRKSWETIARDYLAEGCDKDTLKTKLEAGGATKGTVSKIMRKLKQQGNFQET